MENTKITLVSNDTAEIEAPAPKDTFMSFIPLVLVFIVFYFLIIRPQSKKHKEQQELIKSAKKGDKVVIAGGLIGKIVKEKEDNVIVVELSQGTTVEALRSTIASILNPTSAVSTEKK